MNKKIQAFLRLEQNSKRYKGRKEDLDTIFTMLKKQDSIEITAIDIEQDNQALCKENKKLKRVLEIIKEKEVNIEELFDFIEEYGKHNGLYIYNGQRPYKKRINEEEFDLLKKVLL